MGPDGQPIIIREGLFRGADNGYLLTDRAFAGADTLATSYALATAIRKIGDCDIIIGGRQAIDGDTAQVGPQVAEKLGLTQITYAEEILEVGEGKIKVKRHIDGGVETVRRPVTYRDYCKWFCRSLPSAQCETSTEIQTRQNSYPKNNKVTLIIPTCMTSVII